MRADMAKIIVERPRTGGRHLKGRRRSRDIEDLPTFEGIGRLHGRTKDLSDYLSPLRRFLHSRVGRNWDRVYAEVRALIRPGSTVQQHILQHFFQWVATKTKLVDGRVVVHDDGFLRGGPKPLRECHVELYVHPVSKCLLRNRHYGSWKSHWRKRRAQKTAELTARRRELSADVQLHKLRGLWFEVRLAPLPPATAKRPFDVVLGAGLSRLAPEDLYGRRHLYATAKRQLGRRALRAYGLSNDAEG